MGATLPDGTEVLVDPRPRRPLTAGDVVLARRPDRPGTTLVKRVTAVAADGALTLEGDDPARSTDSRSFGPVPRSAVIGRVVWVFPV